MADNKDPVKPDVQGMMDELRGGAKRNKREIMGVCPTCKRTITIHNTGHAPECNHDQYPQDPGGEAY